MEQQKERPRTANLLKIRYFIDLYSNI